MEEQVVTIETPLGSAVEWREGRKPGEFPYTNGTLYGINEEKELGLVLWLDDEGWATDTFVSLSDMRVSRQASVTG